LEVTLQNIDRDNAEKDADLIAANREIEAVSQTVEQKGGYLTNSSVKESMN